MRTLHRDLKTILGHLSEVKEVKKVMRAGKVKKVKDHVSISLMTRKLVNGVIVWARDTHEGPDAFPGIRWEVMQVEKVKRVGKVMQLKKGGLERLTDVCHKLMFGQEDVWYFRLETPVLGAVTPIPKYYAAGSTPQTLIPIRTDVKL